MTVEIRRGVPADIDAIREIATAAWNEAHAPIVGSDTVGEFLATYYDHESFRERLERDAAMLAVAADPDDGVRGFAFATLPDDGRSTAHLGQLYVAPTRWGEGIGSRLLASVVDESRTAGGEALRLRVMAANDRAVRFYERRGFDRVEEGYDDRIETRYCVYERSLD